MLNLLKTLSGTQKINSKSEKKVAPTRVIAGNQVADLLIIPHYFVIISFKCICFKKFKLRNCISCRIGLNHGAVYLKQKLLLTLQGGADAVKFQSYTLDNYCSIEDANKMLKNLILQSSIFKNI